MRDLTEKPVQGFAFAIMLAFLATSCSQADNGDGSQHSANGEVSAAGPSFAADVQQIFDDNCVACHQTGSAQEDLVLQAGKSFGNIVGVASHEAPINLVEPGDPDRSYLLLKLVGEHQEVGGSGAAMPLGDALPDAQIEQIRSWIEAGAENN